MRERRQGQLHAAGRAAQAAETRANQLRDRGGEPGPEAAGLSARDPAGLSGRRGRALPHRDAGHLQHRQEQDSRRQDHVQPVLAPASRHSVHGGAPPGLQQDRAGPPPRRHRGDLLPEHVLRRQAEKHAAQAGERQRRIHGDPPAGLCEGRRHRALGRAHAVPHHSLQPVRQPGAPAAQAGEQHAARVGKDQPRPYRDDHAGAAERGAQPPAGPQAAQLPRPADHRHSGCGWRQGV